MRKLIPLLLLFVVVVVNSACTQTEKKEATKKDTPQEHTATVIKEENNTGKKIVARVNGKPIYKEDLRGRPLRLAITEEILYQEGLKRGLDKRLQGEIDDYKKRVIVESVRRELITNLPKEQEMVVSDEEMEKYYKRHEDKYTFLSIRVISVGDKDTAEEIRNKLAKGEDVFKIKSEFGGKVTIKDLRFDRQYSNLFDKKEAGSLTEIIEEDNQFKILQITDVKKIPLEKAKNAIKYNIAARKRGKAIQQMVEELKKENNINVEILAGKGKEQIQIEEDDDETN